MDESVAKKLHLRASISARKFTQNAEEIEELAQAVMLNYLSGHGKHQTIDQAVIDQIRAKFGRDGSDNDEERHAFNNPISIETPTIQGQLLSTPQESSAEFERTINGLKGLERAIMVLYFAWGFNLAEIGHCFAVTESRISQRLTSIQARISRRLAKEECKEVPGRVSELHETGSESESKEISSAVESLGEGEGSEVSGLESEETFCVEEEKSRTVENDNEESLEEWFAPEMVCEES